MSTILDALKKSERERALIRGVGFSDASRRRRPRNRMRSFTWVTAATAVLAVSIFAVWRLHRSGADEAAPSGTSADGSSTKSSFAATRSLPAETVTREAKIGIAAPVAGAVGRDGEIHSLSSLSEELRRGMPAMTVNIHVYAPEESQRILYINNRQVRRGDELPGGVVVEDIVPDGAVLRFRGQHVKLPRPS